MTIYTVFCLLAGIAILISYFNNKFSQLQSSIAITAGALLFSLVIVLAGKMDWFELTTLATKVLNEIHFDAFLLKGVLGFLLFAGALEVKLPNLKDQKWEITILSIVATLISTFLVAAGTWVIFALIGLPLTFIYCLLFGALISPTDPIAVLAIVKKMGAPKRIATQIEGESLFNDGISLVIFITVSTIAFGSEMPTFISVSTLFLQEALGGIIYGLLLGGLFHFLITYADNKMMKLLLTIGIATAGFTFADIIHVSGPLAMVVSGILIGNWTRHVSFNQDEEEYLDSFWGITDEFLNSLLFLLIGLSMLPINFHFQYWLLMGLSIPLVLAARYISVKFCYQGFSRFRSYNPLSVKILTWGGLRGGLAIAMAISIPVDAMLDAQSSISLREAILVMTYAVVIFSILVQGSSTALLIKKANAIELEAQKSQSD